ncbi:MAG: fibronectin type III domain-containing protein [Nanoarchaeota archaeon]
MINIYSVGAADPVIFPQKAIVGVTFARVVWATDIASDSKVDYGASTSYSSSVTNALGVTWHVLTISGLSPGTTYHYRITSGATISEDRTFTTYASPTGTVRTVGPGKQYQTIASCVAAMSAGETCLVYGGSYGELVTMSSGSGGNYKTVLAQEPASTTKFTIPNNAAYIAIKGMNISGGSEVITGSGTSSYITIENNYMDSVGSSNTIDSELHLSDWWIIKDNVIYDCGYKSVVIGHGSNNLIDSNFFYGGGNDIIYDGSFTTSVIRNNIAYNNDPAIIASNYHLDFFQWDGEGGANSIQGLLIEGNTHINCDDSSGNCHFVIIRNPSGNTAEHPIIRYNYVNDLDGSGILIGGGSTDQVDYARVYNNDLTEFSSKTISAGGAFLVFYMGDYGKLRNNIGYDCCHPDWYPWSESTPVFDNDYDIAFRVGDTGNWGSASARYNGYYDEPHYAAYRNQDPGLINYPYGPEISSDSFAIDKGGPLTNVATADTGNGTTLAVGDARWFQPGWAGTQADWIAVGSVSNVVQISLINYTTNTITLANSISRNDGDSVWLYKKSDGQIVLYGSAPDVGAFEYVSTSTSSCGEADMSGNSIIEIRELINYISSWKLGDVLIGELITAISKWKNGC